MLIAGSIPRHWGDEFGLLDEEGRALPLRGLPRSLWKLAALSGGRPLAVFGEWDGRGLRPIAFERSLKAALETFTATIRPRRVSRALYTSPIPPAPIGERISYVPSLSPAERGMFEIYPSVPEQS